MPWHRDIVPVDRYAGEWSRFLPRVVPSPTSACTHSRSYVWRSARVAPDSVSEWNRMGV